MLFDKMEDLRDYLAVEYPKSRGKTMACWMTSELSMSVGVYEGDDMVQGLIVYKDPKRDFKWVLLDNFHADLATRNYIEYIGEFTEAVTLFEIDRLFEDEEEENDEDFFETLD